MRTIFLTAKFGYSIIRGIMIANSPTKQPSRGLQVLVCLALITASAAWADTYSFTALPADVAGPAGSTVGWGYSISNASTTSWLVLTALSAGAFDHGSPLSLFDFPTLAPGATADVSFDPVSSLGLYELTWDVTAPTGFVNSGFFDLSAEWWDGDPLAAGNFLSDAPDASAAYSATVTGPASIPEPATSSVLSLFAAFMFFQKARNRTGSPL